MSTPQEDAERREILEEREQVAFARAGRVSARRPVRLPPPPVETPGSIAADVARMTEGGETTHDDEQDDEGGEA
jgi:hypothetical protein